ncbi:hypothetical protein DES34_11834 [Brevibacillus brevis]|nr:hypothetical protein DES34_11834 [Brevibacillus brevis]VEF92632.1 Uncharacterised protein [Brevibacillus brevis]
MNESSATKVGISKYLHVIAHLVKYREFDVSFVIAKEE